ncbi:unnamed protein product [Arctogadus glacialis]
MPKRIAPIREAANYLNKDKTSMLESKHVNPIKGRGVFAVEPIRQGDFIAHYRGELIDQEEADARRKNRYQHESQWGFMFDFYWHGQTWCIDAAKEDGSIGRLVNDDHRAPNSRIKLIETSGTPNLCLFATKDIQPGTEITYNYGGKDLPWRKEVRESRVTGTPEPTETLQGGHVIVLDAMSSSTSSTDHVQYKNLTADFPSSGVKSSATADQVRESRVTGTPEPTETLQGGHVIVLDAMSSSTSSTDHVQYKNLTADFPSSGVKSSATADQVRESRVTGTPEPTETLQGGHVIVLDAMSSSTSSTDHVQYKNLTADFPSSGVTSSATADQVAATLSHIDSPEPIKMPEPEPSSSSTEQVTEKSFRSSDQTSSMTQGNPPCEVHRLS